MIAIAGLLILAALAADPRPARCGRASRTWSEGPGLSVLAHVGMVVGVLVFTSAYLVECRVTALLRLPDRCAGAGRLDAVRSGACPGAAGRARPPRVIDSTVIGHSVQGRDIVAYHLGEPARPGVRTVVLIARMHGNEPASRARSCAR